MDNQIAVAIDFILTFGLIFPSSQGPCGGREGEHPKLQSSGPHKVNQQSSKVNF